MKPETAYTLKTIFGSLFSNQCAIDAGKSFPLWAALIAFAIGVFLPVIPTMVSVSNSSGDAYVSQTYNYSCDKDVAGTMLSLYNEVGPNGNKDFILNNASKLEPNFTIADETQPVSVYHNSITSQKEFEIYYTSSSISSEVSLFFNNIVKKQYIQGSETPKSINDPEGTLYYSPSILLLHKEGMALYLFKYNSTTPISNSNYGGDWLNTPTSTHLIERILTVQGYNIPKSLNDPTLKNAAKYIEGVFTNFKEVMNEGYLTSKGQSFALSSGIYTAVYAGLTLLLGLLVFLLTRGKKNLNRYLKILPCMKITAWTSLAPGILSLGLGFALPNFAVMFYILFEGMRVMWMSMKQLAPTYQA